VVHVTPRVVQVALSGFDQIQAKQN
jgi:hypothetical protein